VQLGESLLVLIHKCGCWGAPDATHCNRATGHLSRFAHQLLDDLLQEANKQQSRLNSVGSRVKALGARLLDETATSTTAASDEMRPAQDASPVSGFFTKPDQPGAIRDRYTSASVGRVPDFSRIDSLVAAAPRPSASEEESSTNSKELCAVLYSNPGEGLVAVCVSEGFEAGCLSHAMCAHRILLQRMAAGRDGAAKEVGGGEESEESGASRTEAAAAG
jgi:hypothetical protein